jgi:hypothetical protein
MSMSWPVAPFKESDFVVQYLNAGATALGHRAVNQGKVYWSVVDY